MSTLTFKSMVYDKRVATFHECGDCGKKFEERETIWKRLGNENIVKEYLCEQCHEKKFMDL